MKGYGFDIGLNLKQFYVVQVNRKTRDPKMEPNTSQFNLACIKLNHDKIVHPCKLIYFNKLLPVEKDII